MIAQLCDVDFLQGNNTLIWVISDAVRRVLSSVLTTPEQIAIQGSASTDEQRHDDDTGNANTTNDVGNTRSIDNSASQVGRSVGAVLYISCMLRSPCMCRRYYRAVMDQAEQADSNHQSNNFNK